MFHAAKLKIKRANKHIVDLDNLLAEFVKTDFYTINTDFDTNTGKNRIQLQLKPISDESALLIGDAIHNLHSALDFMMYEILGIQDDRDIKFPFRETRSELVGAVQKGQIQTAGSIVCDLIINTSKALPRRE